MGVKVNGQSGYVRVTANLTFLDTNKAPYYVKLKKRLPVYKNGNYKKVWRTLPKKTVILVTNVGKKWNDATVLLNGKVHFISYKR